MEVIVSYQVNSHIVDGSIAAAGINRSRSAVVVLVLLPYYYLPILISFDDTTIDSWTNCISVRIEPLLVSFARHSIFLSHAGRIRVVGDSHSISSVVLHFVAAGTCASLTILSSGENLCHLQKKTSCQPLTCQPPS